MKNKNSHLADEGEKKLFPQNMSLRCSSFFLFSSITKGYISPLLIISLSQQNKNAIAINQPQKKSSASNIKGKERKKGRKKSIYSFSNFSISPIAIFHTQQQTDSERQMEESQGSYQKIKIRQK